MQVVLSSTNVSKVSSVKEAFKKCYDCEVDVLGVRIDSGVNDRPINEEILIGAKNRNKKLFQFCRKNKISFDFLVSIEGGYEKKLDKFYVVSYVVITDESGDEYTSQSIALQISRKMFEHAKNKNSLNAVIGEIIHTNKNKEELGVTGFLTKGFLRRDGIDEDAVITAILACQNNDVYRELDQNIVL